MNSSSSDPGNVSGTAEEVLSRGMQGLNIYIGTFLIAAGTLGLEISLTRILSVITWYHLAFFAISLAMLGMTAGATTVYLKPGWFSESNIIPSIVRAGIAYALTTAFSVVVLCLIPLGPPSSVISIFALLTATLFGALPFYFSGIVIAAVLTKCPLPIGRLYASDLLGASFGCLVVLAGVEFFDVPSLILFFGVIGVVASYTFAGGVSQFPHKTAAHWTFILLTSLIVLNTTTNSGIAPLVVKGRIETLSQYIYEKWNSFSRVVVYRPQWADPQLWAGSLKRPPHRLILQYAMNIDGDAGTFLREFSSVRDIEHLKYDLTNVAYYLRPKGGACVIGVGGGRDLQSAILFGHERVLGIEVNPIFIELLEGRFRKFAGLADNEKVRLVSDEARSYLSRSDESFSIIQMSLTDTWAATGAGAFSLSENGLYTVDAWKVFFQRLDEDGILIVSRWYSPENLGETGRVASLAIASLLASHVSDPSRHLAMLTAHRLSSILLAKKPFTEDDIAKLDRLRVELGYDLVISPDTPPKNQILRKIVSARSGEDLKVAVASGSLNYEPPTDDNPYFFNMLRLGQLPGAVRSGEGIVRGNLVASVTLLGLIFCLTLLTIATIVVPLRIKERREVGAERAGRTLWSGAAYFSLIGAGFMIVEIALLQRLSVFLGHPVYALGILLFTIIASGGCGSFLSERLPLTDRPWICVLPIGMAALIIAVPNALPPVLRGLVSAGMLQKAVASVALIFPLGVVMGFFFPCGMRLARLAGIDDTPWYWALNGIFGVWCSALAVFVSIYFGIAINFYIAAACYATLLLCVHRMAGLTSPIRAGKVTADVQL